MLLILKLRVLLPSRRPPSVSGALYIPLPPVKGIFSYDNPRLVGLHSNPLNATDYEFREIRMSDVKKKSGGCVASLG